MNTGDRRTDRTTTGPGIALLPIGLGVLLISLILIAGSIVAARRSDVASSPSLSAPALAVPIATPSRSTVVVASVARDEAIALIRRNSWIARADRIEAKLVSWNEFASVGMGVDMTGDKDQGAFPPQSVWAVAVAGDVYPEYWGQPLGTPRQHFAWALWGVNGLRLQISSLRVGNSAAWPPGFDALVDHVALAPPTPTASPIGPRFEPIPSGAGALPWGRLNTSALFDLAASDTTLTHLWAVVRTGPSVPGAPMPSELLRSVDGGSNWSEAPGSPSSPLYVAATGNVVLVSSGGTVTTPGTSTGGGLFVSTDDGGSWKRVTAEGVGHLFVARVADHALFLAEHPWVTNGAASGPSRIFASMDAENWREVGSVPGPAQFAALDVPVVTYSKNVPGPGFYRVEGSDLASLRLVPVAGSGQGFDATCAYLTAGPKGGLWSSGQGQPACARHSTDLGRTWERADAGLAARIAGLFTLGGNEYALGDGAYVWDGKQWAAVSILTGKAASLFQLGDRVVVLDVTGRLWRSVP